MARGEDLEVTRNTMEIFYKKENIKTIEDLKKLTPRWEYGKSAASIGEFIFEHNGIQHITKIANEILSEINKGVSISIFEKAEFEHETRFDNFGQGRIHDLALYGETTNNKRIFIGIEAKVNEQFDSRDIQHAYLSGLLRRVNGNNSNLPDRVENLIMRNNFRQKTKSAGFTKEQLSLKYQLLYSTAVEDADLCILLILVFKTPLYLEGNGAANYLNYLAFMNAITSNKISSNMDLREVEVFIDDKLKNKKKIYAAYEYIEAKNWGK